MSRAVPRQSIDRLSMLEGKMAKLENKPRGDPRGDPRSDQRDKRKNAVFGGKEVCFHYNSREGCRRAPTTGGCKTADNRKEYAHVCNVWVKSKSGYCLLAHAKKDHK